MPTGLTAEQRAAKKVAEKLSDPFKIMNDAQASLITNMPAVAKQMFFLPASKQRVCSIKETHVFPISNPVGESITTMNWASMRTLRKTCGSNSLVAASEKFEATVAKMETHSDDSRAALEQIGELLCPLRAMEIMVDGKVHKRKSVPGKGGKGKVVAITDTEEKYTPEQGLARQVFWFLNSCSRDEEFRNACFDKFFLGLETTDFVTGSKETNDEWNRIASLFFGVAEIPIEPVLDVEDGLPIPTISKRGETGKKVSVLWDVMNSDPDSPCVRTSIIQVTAEDEEEQSIESPRFVLGCTIQTLHTRGEAERSMPMACGDQVAPMDHRKFVELPPWALTRLRNLSQLMLGYVPAVLERADETGTAFDFVQVASDHFATNYPNWEDGDDRDRQVSIARLGNATWRIPLTAHVDVDEDPEISYSFTNYYTVEQKSVVDTYFTAPGFHDAEFHSAEDYKRYRRQVDGLLKPIIADSIGYKLKNPLIVVDGTNNKRKSPSQRANKSSGGVKGDEMLAQIAANVEKMGKQLQSMHKRVKLLCDVKGIVDEVEEGIDEE